MLIINRDERGRFVAGNCFRFRPKDMHGRYIPWSVISADIDRIISGGV